jgi:polyphosphate kinase 2 (PPK2 family)
MKTKEIIEVARGLVKPFRISKGKDFPLKDVDPNDTLEFTKEADKPRAKEALATGVMALADLQDKLYAQDKWAVLLIFQAMDAAGKDGAIKHVMSGVNPQGCQVNSFKSPSSDAPWYVVPADNKWFTRVVVAAAVVETLADLGLGYPKVGEDKLKELATAKETLLKK